MHNLCLQQTFAQESLFAEAARSPEFRGVGAEPMVAFAVIAD
jgi:hypothetical protein